MIPSSLEHVFAGVFCTLDIFVAIAPTTGRDPQPHIALLREDNARQGFFEPEHLRDVLKHLPEELRPVVKFASITGMRVKSEVLTLECRHIDLKAGEFALSRGPRRTSSQLAADGRLTVFPTALANLRGFPRVEPSLCRQHLKGVRKCIQISDSDRSRWTFTWDIRRKLGSPPIA